MSMINLVPPSILAARAVRRCLQRWVLTLGLTVALLLPAYIALVRLAAARQAEVHRLTGQCTLLQQRLQGAEGLIQERDRLALRRAVVERMSARDPAAGLLEMLERALTPDSYLTVLTLERRDPPDPDASTDAPPSAAAAASTLRLRGRAPGNQQVGEMLRRLAAEPALREVTLVSATDPGSEIGPSEVEFELLCTLADGARSVAP
jgi:Tfp pilus assembly protein PilN